MTTNDQADALERVERHAGAVLDDLAARDVAIVDAYIADATLAEIAARADLTVEGVRQVLVRNDVELRSRGPRSTS